MKLKERILIVATRLVRNGGLMNVTRAQIAEQADCSEANVSYHYGDMLAVRAAIVEHAVEKEIIEVLSQARAIRHPSLGRMSAALKERVAEHITRT